VDGLCVLAVPSLKRKKAVNKPAEKEVAIVQPDPFLEMIERVATNPEIDADKIQKILDMQIQVMDRTARDEFYAAMNRVQAELPIVAREAFNSQTKSKYAKIESIAKAIKPVYTKEGFSMSFGQGKSDFEGYIRITGVLRHSSGHAEDEYHIDLPVDDCGIKGTKNKTMVHATGSTLTYGRRYLTCMIFNVATEDDTDGNKPFEPPAVKVISDPQIKQIKEMVEAAGEDTEKFLKWCKAESIESIPAHKYAWVVKRLNEKIDAGNASTN
jgi:hypothetical protein